MPDAEVDEILPPAEVAGAPPPVPRKFRIPPLQWPVQRAKAEGIYLLSQTTLPLGGGRVRVSDYGELIMLSSYSYLGLVGHPRIDAAAERAIDSYGTGTHGVRLLAGTLDLHRHLETDIAAFKGTSDAIIFSSGYAANVSTITALVGPGDYVVGDELNHASIVDGCILSRARFLRYKHNDPDELDGILKSCAPGRNKLVVADAVFSMDGDILDLPAIRATCDRYGALLMVDEAHSIGVLGTTGHGIEEHFSLSPESVDVKMGTLSKAIPSVGGYVASSSVVIELLRHHGRGFVYSAALPPACTAAAIEALAVIRDESWRIDALHRKSARFRARLQKASIDTLASSTAVTPAICGDAELSWRRGRFCADHGVFVHGVSYPAVPRGTARLRCIVTADMTDADVDTAADTVVAAFRDVPGRPAGQPINAGG